MELGYRTKMVDEGFLVARSIRADRFNPEERLGELNKKAFDRTVAAISSKKGRLGNARAFAAARVRNQWSDTSDIEDLIGLASDEFTNYKSVTEAVSLDGSAWTSPAATFLEPLADETLFGRARPYSRIRAPRVLGLTQIMGAGAQWTCEGAPIPVYTAGYEPTTMQPLKVSGMVVMTAEFAEFAATNDQGAAQLSSALRRAVRDTLDATFISSDAAVDGKSPAGLLLNASTVASTGGTVAQISADLRSMIAIPQAAEISLSSAFWMMSATAYALYRLLKITDADGRLAGLPVFQSSAAAGKVVLVVGEYLMTTLGDTVSIMSSGEGTVEMDDAPTNDSVTPTETTMVSLFHTNSVATRAVLYANWQIGGPSDSSGSQAVVELTGATYA